MAFVMPTIAKRIGKINSSKFYVIIKFTLKWDNGVCFLQIDFSNIYWKMQTMSFVEVITAKKYVYLFCLRISERWGKLYLSQVALANAFFIAYVHLLFCNGLVKNRRLFADA